jgi:hypothetical protein
MMIEQVVKCTNCGQIGNRNHILPLCDSCFAGLEDYEDFISGALNNIHVHVEKSRQKTSDFLRI